MLYPGVKVSLRVERPEPDPRPSLISISADDNGEAGGAEADAEKVVVKSDPQFWCDGSRNALAALQDKRKLNGRACRFYYSKSGCKFPVTCSFAHEP